DDALLFRDFADFANRMDGADLVVGVHDRDEHGFVVDGLANLVGIDHPVLVDLEIGDGRLAITLQRAATVEHRLMLGDAGDDVVALILVKFEHALDREVVRLGGAAGEDDLLGLAADQRRDLIARAIDRLFGFPSETVIAAGGIAELLGEVRQHRLHDARIDRSRRVIIHVNGQLGHNCSSLTESAPEVLANHSGPYKSNIAILRTIINGNEGIASISIIDDLKTLLRRT